MFVRYSRSKIGYGFELPKQERTNHYFKEGYWIISNIEDHKFIEVKNLNDKQKLLSPSGIWNDGYLKDRLEEGWRLEKWIELHLHFDIYPKIGGIQKKKIRITMRDEV
ncbi:hypothetical protein [Sphingobacterium faecium]|uniref:hypothetical protein n=1 Tax=Sphingobacterium faecium TaxID=34087 RepID=UPI0032098B83